MTPCILVLDDDREIREEVCEALGSEGFRTLGAGSGAELWSLAGAHPIQLFVLDLMLPGESGLGIAKAIREKSEVGIVIVTGRGEETDRVVGLELGADDYITKPFSPRELLARVKSVLRRTKGHLFSAANRTRDTPNEVAGFAGWTLDLGARRLRSPSSEDVHLTTAEFELLRAFVESPRRVHSRDYLLDRVHGRQWAGYDRSVDGLVSRLRRKLLPRDRDCDTLIKSVRSVGYMFTPRVSYRVE